MTRARRIAIAASITLATGVARAEAPPPPAPVVGISLTAAPIFGSEASTGNGWNAIVARVDNPGTALQKGILELSVASGFGSSELTPAARAPFAVPPGRSAIVTIPMHPFSSYYAPQVVLAAKNESGTKLESVTVAVSGATNPLLVELAQPPRLGVVLRGWPVPTTWLASAAPSAGGSSLAVGAASVDRTTGDPILPDRASEYGAATLVVVASDKLAALDETKRDALVDWVRAGGTIAVPITRPEDLRSPLMASLVGGAVTQAMPPARLLALPAYAKPNDTAAFDDPDPSDPSAPSEPQIKRAPRSRPLRTGPSDALRPKLVGYEGARLAASDFGATAPCGLGEVHLLAFDPTQSPAIDDPWAQTRVIEMVARAWNRRARVALPVGGGDRVPSRLDEVRRALDPNENFRLGLGISALLLVAYSILVGPVVFTRAAKRGAPLLPLKWVPITSAAAFFAIVLVGFGIKGWRGRARHLTLLEAGSGAARASMRSYRGFFASETRSLSVPSTTPTSVLAVASSDVRGSEDGVLRLDRDGATLSDLTSLPWQTVVVREDGFADWKGAIVVRAATGGNVVVENHSGRVLKDVLVHAPRGGLAYFTTIDDGEVVDMPRGRSLAGVGLTTSTAGTMKVHPLGANEVQYAMLGKDGKRIAEAWAPLEAAAGDAVDWWPDDAPALVGEMVGGTKAWSDAGLALESERVLVHVVGETAP